MPGEDSDRRPLRVATRWARIGPDLDRVDAVEQEDDLQVGERAETLDGARVEARRVQTDRRGDPIPVVLDPLITTAEHGADRAEKD